ILDRLADGQGRLLPRRGDPDRLRLGPRAFRRAARAALAGAAARQNCGAAEQILAKACTWIEDLMFKNDLPGGQRILITGGGTGIGKSIAHRFLTLGAEILICGRRENVLEETAGELMQQTGGRVSHTTCDVRDAAQVEALCAWAWAEAPLTGLINNAAGNFIAQSETLSPRAVDAVLGIVLHGSAYATLACGKRWLAAGRKGNVLSI